MSSLPANRFLILAADNDWQVPQTVPEAAPELHVIRSPYGFLNKYTGYFVHVSHTENEVNELSQNAESCDPGERRNLRIIHENAKWNEEHYMFVGLHHLVVELNHTAAQGGLH